MPYILYDPLPLWTCATTFRVATPVTKQTTSSSIQNARIDAKRKTGRSIRTPSAVVIAVTDVPRRHSRYARAPITTGAENAPKKISRGTKQRTAKATTMRPGINRRTKEAVVRNMILANPIQIETMPRVNEVVSTLFHRAYSATWAVSYTHLTLPTILLV